MVWKRFKWATKSSLSASLSPDQKRMFAYSCQGNILYKLVLKERIVTPGISE